MASALTAPSRRLLLLTSLTQRPAIIFDGSSIGQGNISHYDDPAFNRKLRAVEKLSGASRNRAASRLALEVERDDAPAAAIGTNASRDFFSARSGCQVYQPVYGIDLAALCLRG